MLRLTRLKSCAITKHISSISRTISVARTQNFCTKNSDIKFRDHFEEFKNGQKRIEFLEKRAHSHEQIMNSFCNTNDSGQNTGSVLNCLVILIMGIFGVMCFAILRQRGIEDRKE